MAITGYDVLQDAKTIKEIKTKQDENSQDILDITSQLGDMTQVPTTSKTASGAITELFTNVDNGKNAISGAITDVDSNVVIPTNPSFGDLTSAIGQINTGKKWASGTLITSSVGNISFIGYQGQTVYMSKATVSGLQFTPSTVVLRDSNGLFDGVSVSKSHNLHQGYYLTSSNIRITGNAYLAEGSFQLPVSSINTEYTWIAFE